MNYEPPTDGATHRIWYVPQLPCPAFVKQFNSESEAREALILLEAFSLFEYENRVKPDYCDMGGIEAWSEEFSEWEEVHE